MRNNTKRNNNNTKRKTQEELRDCFNLNIDCDCDTKEKLGNVWNEYGEYMMSTFI